MKYRIQLLFWLVALSCYAEAQAQTGNAKKTTGTPLSAYHPIAIRLDSARKDLSEADARLFSRFEVIDERPDTTRIGIHTSAYMNMYSHTRQLIFDRPASREIAGYLNTHFAQPGAPYTALVILRTLWLSDPNYIREDLVRDPDRRFEKTLIRLKAEIYAVKDGLYTPILRFDSLQVSLKANLTQFGYDLTGMLNDLADSASLLTTQKEGRSRQISLDQIRLFNQSRFNTAITSDSTRTRGVYSSFEEFRNNAPSVLEYEIKKDKGNILLYVKEAGGNSYYSRNAWGYCDGKDIYVMKNGMLHAAWREGNAFYLFDDARVDQYPSSGSAPSDPVAGIGGPVLGSGAGVAGAAALAATSRINMAGSDTHRRVFTVDMDSGEIY